MRFPVLLSVALAAAVGLGPATSHARGPLTGIDGLAVHDDALAPGETLSRLLTREGVSRQEGELFIQTLRRHLNLRRLAAGQPILLYRAVSGDQGLVLQAVAIPVRRGRSVVAVRDGTTDRIRGGVYGDEEAADWIEAAVGAPREAATAGPRQFKFLKGDNLVTVLLRAGATRDAAHRAATGLRQHVNLRRLAIGEPVEVQFVDRDGTLVLTAVALPNRGRLADVRRDAFGVFRPATDIAAERPADPLPDRDPPAEPDVAQADEFSSLRDRLVSRGAGERVDDVFGRGDSLGIRLQRAGLSHTEIQEAVRAFSQEMRPTSIVAGQRFSYGLDGGSMTFFAVADRRRPAVLVARTAAGTWTAQRTAWPDIDMAVERIAGRVWSRDLENPVAAANEEQLQRALETVRIRSGDMLLTVLSGIGERNRHAHAAAAAFGKVARADLLQPGQKFIYPRTDPDMPLPGFFLETNAKRARGVLVLRDAGGRYRAERQDTARAEFELAALPPGPRLATPGEPPAPEPEPDPMLAESPLPEGRDVERLTVVAKRGDTLATILGGAGASPQHIEMAVRAIRPDFDPRSLDIGQELQIALGTEGERRRTLKGFAVRLDPLRSVEVVREGDSYVTHRVERTFDVMFSRTMGTIQTSFYEAAQDVGLPVPVFERLARMFSFDIDFQRDIHPGDDFEVMYEGYVVDGQLLEYGRIVYAAMTVRGEKRSLYYFDPAHAGAGYFDGEGRSSAKALMRTPIDGARVSSRFGMRRHPILGFNRMHRGMDFAAPTGTPIFAAGDGVIERIGRYGAYGNYVRIRHNSDYKTAYAHLSRFAKGLQRGSRVTQGQVIGRVGSTGRSTGPHLHYEVLYRNKQVNPQTIDLPSPVNLSAADLSEFLEERNRIEAAWNDFGPGVSRLAVRPSSREASFN